MRVSPGRTHRAKHWRASHSEETPDLGHDRSRAKPPVKDHWRRRPTKLVLSLRIRARPSGRKQTREMDDNQEPRGRPPGLQLLLQCAEGAEDRPAGRSVAPRSGPPGSSRPAAVVLRARTRRRESPSATSSRRVATLSDSTHPAIYGSPETQPPAPACFVAARKQVSASGRAHPLAHWCPCRSVARRGNRPELCGEPMHGRLRHLKAVVRRGGPSVPDGLLSRPGATDGQWTGRGTTAQGLMSYRAAFRPSSPVVPCAVRGLSLQLSWGRCWGLGSVRRSVAGTLRGRTRRRIRPRRQCRCCEPGADRGPGR
jgi:hypothetical protein